jgi:ketosteroid isomerase-like protein
MKCNASGLASFRTCLLILSAAACVRRSSLGQVTAHEDSEFRFFLADYDEAIRQFAQGNPAKVKTLWSHSPDVSLIGGFGGVVAHGWDEVSARQDWASSQYKEGTFTMDQVVTTVTPEFAYTARIEHFTFRAPDRPDMMAQDLRVTVIFRHEPEGWRVVHRHADQQTTKQPPR